MRLIIKNGISTNFGTALAILFLSISLCSPVPAAADAVQPDQSIPFGYIGSTGTPYIVTGPGAGSTNDPLVRVFDPLNTETPLAEWTAYGVLRYGANVAVGQLDEDLEPEVVTGPGPGSQFGAHVRGFEIDGTPIPEISFLAYGTDKWGVNVALGDLDMDGFDEIITGAGPGPIFGPHVRGWNWDGVGEPTQIPQIEFLAYGTWKWGVNVACGDIDGDGFAEIVTGGGPGPVFGPHVRAWNWDDLGEIAPIPQIDFMAYDSRKRGVNVACGDIDGDGVAEIITAPGPGPQFSAHIRGWDWNGTDPMEPIAAVNFIAYNNYRQMGANVACADVDGDGIDEILTGPGPKPRHDAWVKAFSYDGVEIQALDSIDFIAYDPDDFNYGVKVSGTRAR